MIIFASIVSLNIRTYACLIFILLDYYIVVIVPGVG